MRLGAMSESSMNRLFRLPLFRLVSYLTSTERTTQNRKANSSDLLTRLRLEVQLLTSPLSSITGERDSRLTPCPDQTYLRKLRRLSSSRLTLAKDSRKTSRLTKAESQTTPRKRRCTKRRAHRLRSNLLPRRLKPLSTRVLLQTRLPNRLGR